jgi:hypothetical protein
MDSRYAIVAGRSCGSCTLCCRLPEIDAFSKPANVQCSNCIEGRGCAIYQNRPQLCRDFLCLWMISDGLSEEWHPSHSHMMIYAQGQQITILVDPTHPDAWRQEPYLSQLRRWANDAALVGGYVIVFAGEEISKIAPAE